MNHAVTANPGSALPAPDADDPAQLRLAAAVVRQALMPAQRGTQRNMIVEELLARADRLDADNADRPEAAEAAARLPFWTATAPVTREAIIDALVEFRRAGREQAGA